MTICLGTASVYAALRATRPSGRWIAWSVLSGVCAGTAALNHFWGGVVAITVLALDTLVLIAGDESGDGTVLSRQMALWGSHLLALLPAGTLYLAFRSAGLGGHYNGYLITDAWPLFFDPGWYRVQIEWITRLATTVGPGLVALGIVLAVGLRGGNWRSFVAERDGRPLPTPSGLWAVWFLVGLFPPLLIPGGTFHHSYYYWWALVPAAGLIVGGRRLAYGAITDGPQVIVGGLGSFALSPAWCLSLR